MTDPTAVEEPFADTRKVTDARELRALAHPVRMALIEAIGLNDSLTATQASKIVGGSPTSVAYHLRTLAKYGYVEEAEGGAGRERPWRLSNVGFRFTEDDTDMESAAAAGALSRQLFKRWLARREEYRQHREQWSKDVREATGDWNFVLFGTTEEYRGLQEAFARLCEQYLDRIKHPELRPAGSQVFELQLFTHPVDRAGFADDGDDEHDGGTSAD